MPLKKPVTSADRERERGGCINKERVVGGVERAFSTSSLKKEGEAMPASIDP